MFNDPALLLAQSEKVTNWLTPVWLISVGITVGFLLVLVVCAFLYLISRVPGINNLNGNRKSRILFGSIFSIVAGFVLIGWLVWDYFSAVDFLGNLSQSDKGTLFNDDYAVWVVLSLIAAPVIGFGSVSLISRSKGSEILGHLNEGFLKWLSWISGFFATFAVVGYLLAMFDGFGVLQIVDAPWEKLESVGRLPYLGEEKREFVISPTPAGTIPDTQKVEFYIFELQKMDFLTDQRLLVSMDPVSATPDTEELKRLIDIPASSDKFTYFKRAGQDTVFYEDEDAPGPVKVSEIYIRNTGASDATVTVWWKTEPLFPEAKVIPVTAICVLSVFLAYLLFVGSMPKIGAISLSTFKNEISQPIFILLLVLGLGFILAMIYVPFYTLGEDIKMYKEGVLTFIRVLAIFLAIWSASKSVAEEIEGRTALTVLSKPVGRRQFIVGKFAGISLAVALLFVLLGLWFVIWVSYKPIYDGVETSQGTIDWQMGFQEAMRVIPGLLLGFMEVTIFVAISVAISTRLGILPNFLICFSIYVLGHLTPLIVQSNEVAQAFQPVQVFGRVIATVIPVLDHFDIQAAIMGENSVPMVYVGWCSVYCVMYGSMALLFALVLFEDRDLA